MISLHNSQCSTSFGACSGSRFCVKRRKAPSGAAERSLASLRLSENDVEIDAYLLSSHRLLILQERLIPLSLPLKPIRSLSLCLPLREAGLVRGKGLHHPHFFPRESGRSVDRKKHT